MLSLFNYIYVRHSHTLIRYFSYFFLHAPHELSVAIIKTFYKRTYDKKYKTMFKICFIYYILSYYIACYIKIAEKLIFKEILATR